MRKVDSDRIQSFHMQALRRILGIRWYDKVPNAVVNERTKLPDMPFLIADRRHSLFGHICRLPENTPASQALQLSIEAHTGTPPAADWKRPPSRPRRNWLQQLEEDTGLSVGAAWIAGQDRSMWRTLRPSAACQAQQWVSECGRLKSPSMSVFPCFLQISLIKLHIFVLFSWELLGDLYIVAIFNFWLLFTSNCNKHTHQNYY